MTKLIQLFILPFAGGNASSFNKIIEFINQRIEVIPIEYSGRGSRLKEGYISEYEKFLDDVVLQIKAKRKQELKYALFGYSMGSAFAYEIASGKLLDSDPIHIFYGARTCIKTEELPEMDDDDFVEYSMKLGGFDDRVLQNKRLFKLFVHPLKDDYAIAKQYRFSEGIIPKCDSTVLYSEKDTPFDSICGWKDLTLGNTDFYEFGDNHFFINEYYKEVAEIINSALLS